MLDLSTNSYVLVKFLPLRRWVVMWGGGSRTSRQVSFLGVKWGWVGKYAWKVCEVHMLRERGTSIILLSRSISQGLCTVSRMLKNDKQRKIRAMAGSRYISGAYYSTFRGRNQILWAILERRWGSGQVKSASMRFSRSCLASSLRVGETDSKSCVSMGKVSCTKIYSNCSGVN